MRVCGDVFDNKIGMRKIKRMRERESDIVIGKEKGW
jgi:hypothetical protein